MKKQLLFTAGLLLSLLVYSQENSSVPHPSGKIKRNELNGAKVRVADVSSEIKGGPSSHTIQSTAVLQKENSSLTNTNWNILCGSISAYGMLYDKSRPLQYNPTLNAVSFIHRKSASYNETPAVVSSAKSGVIVAEISSNMGLTWDSTCIWADNNVYGRFPQGAIYNSTPTNTNIANAYIVGAGVAVQTGSYAGAFYASKPLGVPGSTAYNSTPDATAGAMQHLSTLSPTFSPAQTKHAWSRYGFTSTDDGVVRSLGLLGDDNAPTKGVAIVKGTFSGGIFNWTTDSLVPSTVLTSSSNPVLSGNCQMAWSQNGTIGYVVMLGALNTASLSNKGYQPIVYKTANSGSSWAMIPPIDFNSATPEIKQITDHLAAIPSGTTNIGIPHFDNWNIAVDSAGKLHIGALIASGYSSDNDSLDYTAQYTISINPGYDYTWPHTPGYRPYLYDFIGDGTNGWAVKIIDSLSTEDPGDVPNNKGFSVNPWDAGPFSGFKLTIEPRLQLARTPNGNFITFSWTESDTNFISGGLKYNVLPNIKARCMAVSGATSYVVSPSEFNVSKPATGQGTPNGNVVNRATLHYMSPVTGAASISGSAGTFTADIISPFTITNSNPFAQSANNTTWYSSAALSFAFPGTVGLEEKSMEFSGARLYPNPANGHAVIYLPQLNNQMVNVELYGMDGQMVKRLHSQKISAESQIKIDLSNLHPGTYFLTVTSGDNTCTKKLIIK